MVQTERYDTSASGNLIARSEAFHDDLGRVYRTVRHGVDPETGDVGEALTDETWYDPAGNVMKVQPAGAELFTKTARDGLGRPVAVGFADDETYADASSTEDTVVLEETQTEYDAGGNVIRTSVRQRYHNAPGWGPLGEVAFAEYRETHVASFPDALGRVVAVANYGTNGGAALNRPETAPARSDTVLVTSTVYDSAGMVQSVTDPAGMVVRTEYDDAGRRVRVIENYVATGSSSSSVAQEQAARRRTTSTGRRSSPTRRTACCRR
jgi:YD repeat-containing protein